MPVLYGPSGEIVSEGHHPDDLLSGGWREGLPWEGGLANSDAVYGVRRDKQRQLTRTAYFTNALFSSAVDIAVAFLVGDTFSYAAPMLDKAAAQVIEDFWFKNDLGNLVLNRMVLEYLLDGEMCAVLPQVDEDPGLAVPARLGLLDVDTVSRLDADVNEMRAVITPGTGNSTTEIRWEAGRMEWQAHRALWNDRRGWPVAAAAVGPAKGYINLLNHRLNTHELQGRLLGVQKVFVDRGDPKSREKFEAKRDAYRFLPRRGGIVTLAMVEGADGKIISDSLDFTTPGKGASNAETDASALMRLVGLVMGGLPPHWLGDGGDVNRATAGEMGTPAINLASRMQGVFRYFLDRIIRMELTRRLGKDRRYTLTTWETKDDGKTRVKRTRKVLVDQIEIPWIFPKLTQDSLADRIARADAAAKNRWASPQTLSGEMGYDPAVEADRLAAIGQEFGVPMVTPAPAPAPVPTPAPTPEPTAKKPKGKKAVPPVDPVPGEE